jgi:hypothetical protein
MTIGNFRPTVYLLTGVALALFSAWYYTHDTPPNRAQSERDEHAVALAKEKTAQEEEKTKQIKALIRSGKSLSVPLPAGVFETVASTHEVVELTTFPCDTVERQADGFTKRDVQNVFRQDVEYRFSQGCAVLKVSTHVHNLSAASYLLKESGRDFGCGTLAGRNDTPEECRNFLNKHRGQEVQLIIQNGGSLVIN